MDKKEEEEDVDDPKRCAQKFFSSESDSDSTFALETNNTIIIDECNTMMPIIGEYNWIGGWKFCFRPCFHFFDVLLAK